MIHPDRLPVRSHGSPLRPRRGGRHLWMELGLNMVRSRTVGVHPRFVAMLRELDRGANRTVSPSRADGRSACMVPSHDVCPELCCLPPARPHPAGRQSDRTGEPRRPGVRFPDPRPPASTPLAHQAPAPKAPGGMTSPRENRSGPRAMPGIGPGRRSPIHSRTSPCRRLDVVTIPLALEDAVPVCHSPSRSTTTSLAQG